MEGDGSPPEPLDDAPARRGEDEALPDTVSASGGGAGLRNDVSLETLQDPGEPRALEVSQDTVSSSSSAAAKPSEILRALEVVERDSVAIAESYACLFSSLRLALSEVTSTSLENMQCFGDVVGNVQESALDAATKGNRYINSCLRLNAEMKGLESLAVQLKILRKNVDSLDLAVNRMLRLP